MLSFSYHIHNTWEERVATTGLSLSPLDGTAQTSVCVAAIYAQLHPIMSYLANSLSNLPSLPILRVPFL